MLIVVEGPEGAGKTTWCREFQDLWKLPSVLVHHTPTSSNSDTISQELSVFGRLPNDWAILFDRWFYSDYVYKPLQGKQLEMDMDLEEADENFGSAIDFRVLLLPELTVLQSRAQPDDAGIDKALERQAYENFFGEWPRNVAVEPVVERLQALLKEQAEALKIVEAAQASRDKKLQELSDLGRAHIGQA